MKRWWHARELSTVAILALEIAFFTWYLWPESGRTQSQHDGCGRVKNSFKSFWRKEGLRFS